jgi:hypothetical protein
MLSLTMEEIRACIPFGAAHRVNFDTPPLQGNCPDTLVSQQIPLKTQHDYKTRYLARYRDKHGMEVTMDDVQTMRDRPKEKLRGRDRRSLNLSTKLTAVEARVIEDAATRAGKTPSEWAREALLRAAQGGSSNPLGMDIFIESVGSQMLMMAAFDPLLKASGMTTEYISALFDRVQKTKLIRAQELLAKRTNRRAEEARRATE